MKIIHYTTISSTNDIAKKLIAEGAAPHGTTIAADMQDGGRGRMGRSFFSPAGGVYMSVVVGSFQAPPNTLLTVAAAVAVTDAIKAALGVDAGIKWVNDIFYDGKKVGGILTETAGDKAIVGIGLNLRTKKLPPKLPSAGSLLSVAGNVTAMQMTKAIQKSLIDTLDNFDARTILDKYRFRSILTGKRVLVTMGDVAYEATAVDIADDGGLVVEKAGERITLTYGEASLILHNSYGRI